jgi:hypothetical protein
LYKVFFYYLCVEEVEPVANILPLALSIYTGLYCEVVVCDCLVGMAWKFASDLLWCDGVDRLR